MCDTAPLAPPHAPVGCARPPFIRPVLAPRTTTQLARSFSWKFRPGRDATLPADRQMTHLADVAPPHPNSSGPNCSEAHPPRRAVRGRLFLSWSDNSRLRFLREACFVAFPHRKYKKGSGHVQTPDRAAGSVSARSKMRQSAPAGDEDSSPPGDSRPGDLHPSRPAKGASCRAPKNTTNPPRHARSVIPGEAGNDFLIAREQLLATSAGVFEDVELSQIGKRVPDV
jgi:hypothetical protein